MSNVKSNEYYSNNNYKSTNNTNSESSLNNKNSDIDLNPCEININIQTSENTHERLTLTTNDNIDEKVDAFCKAHNFPQSVRLMLIQQVEEQIDQKISQMEGYSEDNDDSNEMNRITPTKSLIMSKSCDNIIAPKPIKKKKRRHSKSPSGYGQEMYEREMHRRQRRLNHYQKLKEENEQRESKEIIYEGEISFEKKFLFFKKCVKCTMKLYKTKIELCCDDNIIETISLTMSTMNNLSTSITKNNKFSFSLYDSPKKKTYTFTCPIKEGEKWVDYINHATVPIHSKRSFP